MPLFSCQNLHISKKYSTFAAENVNFLWFTTAENVNFLRFTTAENVKMEMSMKRKIYAQLLDWKRNMQGKSALLIEGARRIGKSYIVEKFAKNEYKSYIIIDFARQDKEVINIFEHYLSDFDMLFQMLSIHYDVELIPRNSVIVFDEVQQYPKARAAIKYLVADGRYDYIETGSLISIKKNVKDIVIPSEEQHINMYPMDFEEFLWALDNTMLLSYIKECFDKRLPLGPIHRKAMDLFRLYMVIGGMPQAVDAYRLTKDFRQVERIKQDILTLYRDDIRKYATGAEQKALAVWDALPGQLQMHDSRFVLADLDPKARYMHYESAFFWLNDSRIVNLCYNTTAPNIGLGMNLERTTLKCYMSDTGLLISQAFSDNGVVPATIYERLLHGNLEVNLGMVMENIVAQMLQANHHKLFFYHKSDKAESGNNMEIDFLIAKSNVTNRKNIIPIEVKSTKSYRITSLLKCVSKFNEYISNPTVLHIDDTETKDGITFLPIYMAYLL